MNRKRNKEREQDEEEAPRKQIRVSRQKKEDKENTSEDINNVLEIEAETSRISRQRTIKLTRLYENDVTNLRSGKIRKIVLRNFMCHQNFEVCLNPCVNVFLGLNGSGKSAILTAICVGLGSKASSTARSTSLKDLVRRGEASASIEITLSNDGIDSYDAESFGKEIVICRNINANTGASTYKLKTSAGRVVSSSHKDLLKLTLFMNIQVENPVLLLNQDAARSFLKECDPKKLYLLFVKATQIEAIINKLDSCYKTSVESKNRLLTLKKNIQHQEEEIKLMKEKHERLQSVSRLQKTIENDENEIDWIRIAGAEKELKEMETDLNKKHDEVRQIELLIANKGKYEKEKKDKIRDLGTNFQVLNEELTQKSKVYEDNCKEFETFRDSVSEVESSHKAYADKLAKLKDDVEALEKAIGEQENNPNNGEKLKKENMAKIQKLEVERNELNLILQNSKRDYQMFAETLNGSKEKLEQIQQKMSREKVNVNALNSQIAQYKDAGKDVLTVYGPSMTKLIKELEKLHHQKKFQEMPRGPLGRYIQIADKKYRQPVENILEKILTSFLVSCDADRMLLTELLKKYNDIKHTQIITSKFTHNVYDVRNGMAQLENDEGEVLINIIKVKDPVVMNCLIDQRGIERIVLVNDTDTAIRLTKNEETVPPNLQRVVQLNPFCEYYPAPNYRTYSLQLKPAKYIQTNFRDLIAGVENQKKIIEAKCEVLKNDVANTQKLMKEQEEHVQNKKRLMNELISKDMKYSQEIAELKSIEYPEENDIDFFRTELQETLRKRKKVEEKISDYEMKLRLQHELLDQKKRVMDESLQAHQQFRCKLTALQDEIIKIERELERLKIDAKSKGATLALLKQEQDAMQQTVQGHRQKLTDMLTATKGRRVDSNRRVDEILQIISLTKSRIRNIESSNEKIQDIEVLLNSKIKEANDLKEIYEALDTTIKKLNTIRESRYVYVRSLRQHMTMKIKYKFNQIMQLREYMADVEIDHKQQTLELKVIPRDGLIEGAVSGTKSLSGGERSYSTVAFLIALWSCVDHPFYFLDEYDVFSDEYNRHMMTLLLFNEAKKNKERQFGFLTPQDFSNIQASDTITIHKLQDPERMN